VQNKCSIPLQFGNKSRYTVNYHYGKSSVVDPDWVRILYFEGQITGNEKKNMHVLEAFWRAGGLLLELE
jgi:hypothetical protein